jgi:serine/threonine protein kinase
MASDDSQKTQITSVSPTGVSIGTQIIGTYEIKQHIATGGMGEVYRGVNIHTNEPVAIKIVLAALAHDEKIISMFQKEATVLGRLHHDAIVRYNMFTIDPTTQRACLVMEYVEGRSMADYIEDGPMSAEDVKTLLRRLAPGLQRAHDLGVVHRDLSPDNVIVQDGLVSHTKIIDFGIAKSENFGGGTLLGGQFAGKYNYVSPEQLGRFKGIITGQSDIYSLGLVAAAAALGRPLDMGDNPGEAVDRRSAVPDLSGVADEVRPILECMLQPDPANRPATMADVVMLLDNPQLLPQAAVASVPPAGQAGYPAPGYPNQVSQPPQFGFAGPGGQGTAPPQGYPPTSQPPGGFAPVSQPPAYSVPPSQHPSSQHPSQSPAYGQSVPPVDNDSPFGPPTTPPVRSGGSTVPPTSGSPRQTQTAKKKSPVMILVLLGLLAAGGGGGAYMAGLFGTSQDGGEALVEAQTTGEPGGELPSSPGRIELPSPQDAEPETVVAAAPPEPVPAPVPVPEPEPEPTPPASVQDPDPDLTEVASAPPLETPPADETADTGGDFISKIGERIKWVQDYPLTSCVLAEVMAVTPTSFAIEGYATSADPFWQLLTDFEAAHGTEPDIGVRLIKSSQCAVIRLLKGLSGRGGQSPKLSLDKDVLKSGEPIRGRVEQIADRNIWLMLVDAQGGTYDLSSRLKPQDDGSATFALALRPNTTGGPDELVPQMIVAVASDKPIANAKAPPGTPADVLIALVETELRNENVTASAAVSYFRFDTE